MGLLTDPKRQKVIGQWVLKNQVCGRGCWRQCLPSLSVRHDWISMPAGTGVGLFVFGIVRADAARSTQHAARSTQHAARSTRLQEIHKHACQRVPRSNLLALRYNDGAGATHTRTVRTQYHWRF